MKVIEINKVKTEVSVGELVQQGIKRERRRQSRVKDIMWRKAQAL